MGSAEAAPSDTQVVSQSVFDRIIKQNEEERSNSLRTLYEGESGHINLLAEFENPQFGIENAEDNEDNEDQGEGEDEGVSSPLDYQPNKPFPESQRFIQDKTPATVVKRARIEDGNNDSPSYSWNPLVSESKSNGGTMGLSQIFESTQVPSSPLVNRQQQSDQLSDRPSPNLPIQHFPVSSTFESPSIRLAATFPQDSSEPNMNYISMKESQAERERIRNQRLTRSAEHIYSEDQSDDEFHKEPSFVERMRRRKSIDRESSEQLAGVSAPARPVSSNRRRKRSNSLHKDQETQGNAHVPEGRQEHEPLQNGAVSEEETEQEDEPYQSVPRYQQPNSSEEDKENYNDESAPPPVATVSAHNRLSQALALGGGRSPSHRHVEEPTDYRQQPRSPIPNEQVDGVDQSSQTYIVKDSQQSPTRDNRDGGEDHDADEPHLQNSSRGTHSQQQEGHSDVEKSPSPKPPVQSSPPPSMSQQNPPSLPNNPRARSASVSSNEIPSQIPKTSSAPEGGRTQSSNSVSQPVTSGEKASTLDREKPSSMPSRVAETPVHQSKNFGNVAPGTVPETSPNRLQNQGWNSDANGDAVAQEDDDLPPVYPTDHDRGSQSQPPGPPTPATVKTYLNSKILSSPSGRKRRRLTDIASEDPPEENENVDLNIGILTADDKEFTSVVAKSNPPKKRRRGNDGQRTYSSDTVRPATPRPGTPGAAHVQEQEPIPEQPQPAPPVVAETVFHKRTESPNRMGSIWDVDASPQYRAPRTGRRSASTFSQSSLQKQQPAQLRESEKAAPAPSANVDDHQHHIPRENIEDSALEPNGITAEESTANGAFSSGEQIAYNQVLAPWTGQKRAYYPATCFGTPFGTSASRYVVKFEDSLPIEVPMSGVKRLEFRIGDAVKVEMAGVPRVTHIIRGFDDKISQEELVKANDNGPFPITDVYGHSTLILGPKQRKSLPNGGLPGPESVIRVPISRIYLDTILWNQLKDRTFTYNPDTKTSDNRFQTPPDRHTTLTTPSPRLSRSIRCMGGLFAGMIFAVSYVDDDRGKSRVTRSILENDGHIINGFNELFDFPSNVPLASPTKPQVPSSAENKPNLCLTNSAEDVGFACVIADKHSRREKYMQALALNLPCLSGRWVEDCIAQNSIVDWETYLLPAGDSMYLNGAAKSRILAPSPATSVRFSQTIAGRPKLLDGQSVLIVMGRGKEEEKSKAYIFLTYALGASRVERVYDLKSAKSILDQESEAGGPDCCSWNWVYVHGCDHDVVKSAFLGSTDSSGSGSHPGRGTKKRKPSHFAACISGQDLGLSPKVTIVGNDFVCQSLILGKLFEA